MERLNLLRDLSKKDKDVDLLRTTCTALIDVVNNHMKDLEDSERARAYVFLRDAHTDNAPYYFESFLIAMEWNRQVDKRFYQPRMSVLKPITKDLQDLEDGEIDIYTLSMPPRVGKSTIGLFYMAWIAGRHPYESIFAVGYSSGLVKTFYDGVYDFINSEEYRFRDIFPSFKLSTSAEARTIDIGNDERYKTITFRSIDGQITGALEAESLLYMDDMCSGIEEAMNLDRLDKLWSKVSVDVLQRRVMNKRRRRSAPILMIGTIWSLHDPISKLKYKYQHNKRFRCREMPALNYEGKSNFNYSPQYGIGFTTDMYHEMRENMDEVSWECVYQQNPIERDGLLFAKKDLKRYLNLPNKEPDSIVAVCDVAFGADDYLSFPIAYVYGDDIYIDDVVFRCKASYQVTEPMVCGKIVAHGVQMSEFESNNGGDFYARDVDEMVKKTSTHKCHITWSNAGTRTSKLMRIIQYQTDIRNFYFKDESLYSTKDDYWMFMNNLTTFVQTGGSKHDDAPDSLAMLSKVLRTPRMGRITSNKNVRGIL